MRTFGIVALAPLLVCAATATAHAQTRTEGETTGGPPRAPSKAFELSVDGGYTQGFGSMYGTRSVNDVAGAGLGVGVGLAYRSSPGFSLGVVGQLQGFNTNAAMAEGTKVQGLAAGVAATFHTAPFNRADPYLTLGTGYRVLMEQPGTDMPTTLTHGFQLGRVELGVDVRPSESVSFSPVVGADLDMFMWQKSDARAGRNEEITNRGVSGFLFAGVRGRFDVGGTREAKPREAPATTTVVIPSR